MTADAPDWASVDLTGPTGDCPVAFCGDLSPASVLAAYRRGIVPFPAPDEFSRHANELRHEEQVASGLIALLDAGRHDPYRVAWWSPCPRLILPAGELHLGRNVRKQLRRHRDWATTADQAFSRVARECRAGREPAWLTGELLAALESLHQDGWAHSVEVWAGSDLAGGAIGIGIGHTFSGDSLFGRRPEAARVAVADLADRVARAGGTVIDAQWDSPLLRSLGARLVPREQYLRVLARSTDPLPLPARRLAAHRLLPGPADGG